MFYLVEIMSPGAGGSKWLNLAERKFLVGYLKLVFGFIVFCLFPTLQE